MEAERAAADPDDVAEARRVRAEMDALVLPEDTEFDPRDFTTFLRAQSDLGPKQWPSFVRVAAELPRTETGKLQKHKLRARYAEQPRAAV